MMNPEPANTANRPQQTGSESPWWLKHLTRFVGTASALVALATGVIACITLTPRCLLAGILQMLFGLTVALIEAPCLCMFLDFAQAPSQFFDRKPHWLRAVLYGVFAIVPITLYAGPSILCGSGLIFVAGILYGMMALGKKAPIAEMRVKASSSYNLLQTPKFAGDPEAGNAAGVRTEPKRPGDI